MNLENLSCTVPDINKIRPDIKTILFSLLSYKPRGCQKRVDESDVDAAVASERDEVWKEGK